MKKLIGAIFALVGVAIIFSACGGETYADKLKKEEKAIERFKTENNIEVLYKYPDKHKFAENQYFLEPTTGIYIHVIDSGNKDKPTNKTSVYLRYDTIFNILDNSVGGYPNFVGSPMYFEYGNPTSYMSYDASSQMYYFLSQACVIPLEFGLGRYAEVKLIVPFANGSSYQQGAYEPYFYSRLQYDFQLDVPHE